MSGPGKFPRVTVVLVVDDEGAAAHGVAAVAHLALAGAHLLRVDHALELLATAEALQRLDGGLGILVYFYIL